MKEDRETRYHPDTLEPVEKPEDWASYSIKIGLTVETRDEIKFNQMWDDWNNALTLEQVFERYKEMREELNSKNKKCPHCKSTNIIMFTADLDYCQGCDRQIDGQ